MGEVSRQRGRHSGGLVVVDGHHLVEGVIELFDNFQVVLSALERFALARHLTNQGVVDIDRGSVKASAVWHLNPAEVRLQGHHDFLRSCGVIDGYLSGFRVVVRRLHPVFVVAEVDQFPCSAFVADLPHLIVHLKDGVGGRDLEH